MDLDKRVTYNFKHIDISLLLPVVVVILLYFLNFILISGDASTTDVYIAVQKEWFYSLNKTLSGHPVFQENLTQLGDVLIFFPFLSVFVIYAPRFWEALLTSSVLSLLVSGILKKISQIPRPANIFDNESFVIIGKSIKGHSSFPSGHSTATFVIITTILLAFMPKKRFHKLIWTIGIVLFGVMIAFSRVAVGAHYPLDVVFGSTLGYGLAIIGIQICNQVNWITWFRTKYKLPLLLVILLMWFFLLAERVADKDLVVLYMAIFALVPTAITLLKMYVKKN